MRFPLHLPLHSRPALSVTPTFARLRSTRIHTIAKPSLAHALSSSLSHLARVSAPFPSRSVHSGRTMPLPQVPAHIAFVHHTIISPSWIHGRLRTHVQIILISSRTLAPCCTYGYTHTDPHPDPPSVRNTSSAIQPTSPLVCFIPDILHPCASLRTHTATPAAPARRPRSSRARPTSLRIGLRMILHRHISLEVSVYDSLLWQSWDVVDVVARSRSPTLV
jgi:hypothetical protein